MISAAAYWNSEYTHVDYTDGLGGFVTSTPIPDSSWDSWYVKDIASVGSWLNTTNANNAWSTGTNWGGGSQPTSAVDATFDLGNTYTVNVTSAATAKDVNVSTGNVTLSLGSQTLQASGNLNVSGGSLTHAGTLKAGTAGAVAGQISVAGNINLSGGTLKVGSLDLGGVPSRFLGNGTTTGWTAGTLELTNSDLDVGSSGVLGGTTVSPLDIGTGKTLRDVKTTAATAGRITVVSGGSLTISGGTVSTSVGSTGGPGADFRVNGGGLLTVSAGSLMLGGPLSVGTSGTGTGTANFSGGTIAVGTESGTDRRIFVGQNINGVLNQSGAASVSTPSDLEVGYNATGTYNLSGGTLTVGGTTYVNNDASKINLTGGTLKTGILDTGNKAVRFYTNWTAGTLELTNASNEVILGTNGPLNTASISLGNGKHLKTTSYTYVGNGSATTLNITNGGTWTHSGASGGVIIANGTSSSGSSVTIDGAGSAMTISGPNDNRIGAYGTGTLTVRNGGSFSATANIGLGTNNVVGTGTGNGIVNVQDVGTTFSVGGNLTIAVVAGTTGNFNMNGGTATVGGTTAFGTGTGTLHVSGGTFTTRSLTLTTASNLNFTNGTLQIDGGTYTQPTGTLVISGDTPTANPLFQLSAGATNSLNNVTGVVIGGAAANRNGELLIEGGSVLANTGNASNVGTYGSHTVQSGFGYLGLNTGSSGTATVTGSGSKWTNTWELLVGHYGTGTLNVLAGGEVSNTQGYLGRQSGSSGTATVTGSGSKWTSSQSLYVGHSGTGVLNVLAAGEVSSASGIIGRSSGSSSTATVTGSGSKWTNTGGLYVGYNGTGVLNVLAGGEVSNSFGYLGYNSGSSGTATVTGSGSKWTNTGGLYVGYNGTGVLNVQAGGEVSSTFGVLANEYGSSGTATVTGSGSKWTNTWELLVGHYGTGTLNVLAGGEVSNTDGYLGLNIGSSGTATVTGSGSKWTNSQQLYIGYNGTGTLNVQAGGAVSSISGYLGFLPSMSGAATVTGSGSKWTNSQSLSVGYSGTGVLNVESGGTVEVTGPTIVNSSLGSMINLSGGTLKTGALDLEGVATRLNWTSGKLHITNSNLDSQTLDSTLILGAARTLEVNQTTTIAAGNNVTVAGGSFTTGGLNLQGSLTLSSGLFRLTNQNLTIGSGGLLGANLTVQQGMEVAIDQVTTINAGNRLNVLGGTFSGGQLVNNGRISMIEGDIGLTGASSNAAGATFSVIDADLAFGTGANKFTNLGRLNLIDVVITGDVSSPAGSSIDIAGTVTFNGSVSGAGNFAGAGHAIFNGVYSPGDSPALTTFDGDQTYTSNNVLVMEIGGLNAGSEFDRIEVGGTLTLGGTLQVILLNGFDPQLNNSFDLFDWGELSGTFSAFSLPSLSSGLAWDTSSLYVDGSLSVTEAAVPEPASLLMLGLGAVGLLGRRRRN